MLTLTFPRQGKTNPISTPCPKPAFTIEEAQSSQQDFLGLSQLTKDQASGLARVFNSEIYDSFDSAAQTSSNSDDKDGVDFAPGKGQMVMLQGKVWSPSQRDWRKADVSLNYAPDFRLGQILDAVTSMDARFADGERLGIEQTPDETRWSMLRPGAQAPLLMELTSSHVSFSLDQADLALYSTKHQVSPRS